MKQIFQKLRIDQAPETNRSVLAVLAFLRSDAHARKTAGRSGL